MRGEKLTELLKQPQYQPQPMEDQVAIIYAATNGFVNDIPTAAAAELGGRTDRLPARQASADSRERSRRAASSPTTTKKQLDAALAEFNKSF